MFTLMAYFWYLILASDFFMHLWWWDIIVHTLGGVWAGLIAAWFFIRDGKVPPMLHCIGFALFSGVGIEILEYAADFGGSIFMSYPLDTAKDLVVDAMGGYLAWRYVRLIQTI